MAIDDLSSKITAKLLDGSASGSASADAGIEQHINVLEISGTIKWFDATKGYGFIIADNGMADVLLHITCLRKDGYQTAHEGARIIVQASQGGRGYQAFHIVSMDESTALHPAQMPAPRTHVSVTPTSGLELAVVKWFNRLRGFGFVSTGEGKPDIFVHMEILRRFGILELTPGQSILVRYGDSDNGLMAAEVRLVEGSRLPSSH
jgi:cold shock protein